MSLKLISIDMKEEYDESPDLSYLEQFKDSKDPEEMKYAKQDKSRLDSYYNDEWCMLGIRAIATIRINGILQTVSSRGLWGIESDSGDDYKQEVFEEEKIDLFDQLREIGFSEESIKEASN